MIAHNILDTIGNTPLVRLGSFSRGDDVNIYAKLEGTNPSGSIKDRPALRMIEAAESDGRLIPGKTIVEASSGNMGISLALIGAVKGYKVKIFMSESVSVERRKILAAYGAEVVLTPAAEGTDGAIRRARALAAADPDGIFMPDQFSNKGNYMAHFITTASEILQQTRGRVDYVVSAIGTSGTLMGLAKYLKEADPRIKIVCAQPVKGHYIQGLKNLEEAIVPAIYHPDWIDIQEMIETEDAFEMARRVIRDEGIFVGMSSGAALLAAVRVAARIERGNIVVIFPDRGEKYISTSLFG
ncbi:MAG: cysteine synthase family protein [Bacteroidales bacterium]|nr:cysteine synthase family protein [Bacteroidales bacterium]